MKPIAFMPYARNKAGQTCWGAFDFDAHDGNASRARDFAFKAWTHLREIRPDLCVILETSASGGWHVWIIKEKLVPCEAMATFLKKVAEEIGAEVCRGICEIFPGPMNNAANLGSALRAPGSYHPGTNACMQMVACNLGSLIAALPPQKTPSGPGGFPNRDKYLSISGNKEQRTRTNGKGITDENLGKNDVQKHEMFELGWAARYPINEPSQRNDMLKSFVQQSFQQLGKGTARRIAAHQFQQKTVPTEADLEEHLRDFETIWRWCEDTLWKPKLTENERAVFNSLSTDTDRDAFRIIWNFYNYANG
jgi:hypothetical protein